MTAMADLLDRRRHIRMTEPQGTMKIVDDLAEPFRSQVLTRMARDTRPATRKAVIVAANLITQWSFADRGQMLNRILAASPSREAWATALTVAWFGGSSAVVAAARTRKGLGQWLDYARLRPHRRLSSCRTSFPSMRCPRPSPYKGGQWRVNPKAVAKWLAARAAREAERRRLQAQRAAEYRAQAERQAAARYEAEQARRRREREAEERRIAEIRQRREAEERAIALGDCHGACFRLAMKAYGVSLCPGWRDLPENQAFLNDWSSRAAASPPAWWAPPPGMLEFALAERRRLKFYNEPEPDWGQFLGDYKFGTPWPWRVEPADAER